MRATESSARAGFCISEYALGAFVCGVVVWPLEDACLSLFPLGCGSPSATVAKLLCNARLNSQQAIGNMMMMMIEQSASSQGLSVVQLPGLCTFITSLVASVVWRCLIFALHMYLHMAVNAPFMLNDTVFFHALFGCIFFLDSIALQHTVPIKRLSGCTLWCSSVLW
jgi:hypothetical protein